MSISRTGPHLGPPEQVSIPGARQLVTDGRAAYVGAGDTVHVIDVSDSRPTVVGAVSFRADVSFLELRGDTLLVGERGRAIDFVDVSDPARPRWFDCLLSFGTDAYPDVASAGDHLVVPLNWDGVGIAWVADPGRARWVARSKLDQGFVEHLAVADGKVFAAGASGGLRVFALDGDALVEIARPWPGFHAARVHAVGDRVWVAGHTPAAGRRREGKPEIRVIDPAAPDTIEHQLQVQVEPAQVVAVAGGAVGFDDHRWYGYAPAEGWTGPLFAQYVDEDGRYVEGRTDERELRPASDVRAARRIGDRLFVLRTDGLWVHPSVAGAFGA